MLEKDLGSFQFQSTKSVLNPKKNVAIKIVKKPNKMIVPETISNNPITIEKNTIEELKKVLHCSPCM